MHPIDSYIMIRRKQEDLLRQAERERLVRAVKLQQHNDRSFRQKWANWLGIHLVR